MEENPEPLTDNTSERPGRMKRAQSAFKVKLKRNESQQALETPSSGVRPSTLARKGWRGFYTRRTRRKRTAQETIRDVEKSQLLFSELFLAHPMVMAAASSFVRDGSDEQRVPVLLAQISIHVEQYDPESKRTLFKINLEYGSGPAQLKWHIIRSYRDLIFFQGHLLKANVVHRKGNRKPPKLPRPRDYGRKVNNDEVPDDDTFSIESDRAPTFELAIMRYLQRILQVYAFQGDSDRILHFIEFSRLGLSLAASTNFHGKEGPMFIRGRASQQGWSVSHWQPQDISNMIHRHTQKWLLVRESYLIITESINSTLVLDVFLVDPKFTIKAGEHENKGDPELAKGLFMTLKNSTRTLKIATRGELDLGAWLASITLMQEKTIWSQPQRFDSFAPVRENVSCEWFVDGRDYMWVLSEALENARDTIFIHDWWLSPELYLRRPPEGNQRWRLDRTLKRAADRGVKIFVIVYRNIDLAIPIDSMWTKHSLFDLSSNIHVLRSPNQPKQKAAMFWAHHEKLCIIDNTIAFAGGIDLCFGRWDTPQHTIVDDPRKPFFENSQDAELPLTQRPFTQTWPGKDYSNPRVKDFFELDKPYDDMYDRQTVPRMPWHDIHQSVLGQPARDLARHFVERWNYVIRQKLPSRSTPLLVPPSDFTDEELKRLKLDGTCEYQVLRSSCNWSLGLKEHEQSIQNAYLKLIDSSEHFIYIENQFFITSTEVDGVKIENQIGNALVQRIIRAHERGEHWRAIIVIPLMPGFEAPVDSAEASSVRVICQCQYNSISRGTHSIFYKLESAGIIPDNYISFFSLRKWGKIGPESRITTEQLYIHAKMMVADDRNAIIGSANINERSMRGIRDSEVAVCVRDTATIDSKMAGKPYKVTKFAHTLRLRVMREHMGIDTDKVDCIDQLTDYLLMNPAKDSPVVTPDGSRFGSPVSSPLPSRTTTPAPSGANVSSGYFSHANSVPATINSYLSPTTPGNTSSYSAANLSTNEAGATYEEAAVPEPHSFNWLGGTESNIGLRDHKKLSYDRRIKGNQAHKRDVQGFGYDQWANRLELEREDLEVAINPAIDQKVREVAMDILTTVLEHNNPESVLDFKRIFYNTWCKQPSGERVGSLPRPLVDEDGHVQFNESYLFDPWSMDDPVSDEFYLDKWMASAERNTDIYRQVFKCQPDNQVETWREYKKSQAHEQAFYEKQASEGGPEVQRTNRAPERVNIHVQPGSTGVIPDVNIDYPEEDKDRATSQRNSRNSRATKASDSVPGITVDRSESSPGKQHHQHHLDPKRLWERHEVKEQDEAVEQDTKDFVRAQANGKGNSAGVSEDHAQSGANDEGEDQAVEQKEDKKSKRDRIKADRRAKMAAAGEDAHSSSGSSSEYYYTSDSDSSVGDYGGKAGGSSTAGVPGIPSFAAIFGGNKAYKPKHTIDEAADDYRKQAQENQTAHKDHRTRKYVDAADTADVGSGGVDGSTIVNNSPEGSAGNSLNSAATVTGSEGPSFNGRSRPKKLANVASKETLGEGTVSFPEIPEAKRTATNSSRKLVGVSSHTGSDAGNGGRRMTVASRRWKHFDQVLSSQSAEEVLSAVTGHLVLFPTEWLRKELESGNWNFQMDRMTPLDIYD